MARFLAVLVLTICQFTAFPFLTIVASNTERHSAELQAQRTDLPNVTVVYKTNRGRNIETL